MPLSHLLIRTDTSVCIIPANHHASLNRHCYKQQMTTKLKEQGILHRLFYCSRYYSILFTRKYLKSNFAQSFEDSSACIIRS